MFGKIIQLLLAIGVAVASFLLCNNYLHGEPSFLPFFTPEEVHSEPPVLRIFTPEELATYNGAYGKGLSRSHDTSTTPSFLTWSL